MTDSPRTPNGQQGDRLPNQPTDQHSGQPNNQPQSRPSKKAPKLSAVRESVHDAVHDDLTRRREQVAADLRQLADETNSKASTAWRRFLHRPWTNAWRIFGRDVKTVCTNVIGLIVAVGLIVIPAFYSLFNIAGAWDVYSNAGGLKVAVANQDEGYQSDLLPMKVSVGNKLTDALRANKNLGWTFVSRNDAVEGVHSGKYYAAIVIPKKFSADMMTFFTPSMKKAEIIYYENQKENPLAPKVTDQGADAIRSEINSTFSTTVTSVALDVATTLGKFVTSPNAQHALTSFVSNVDTLASSTKSTAGLVDSYGSIVLSAADVVSSAGALLPSSSSLTDSARTATKSARSKAEKASTRLDDVSASLRAATTSSETAARAIASQSSTLLSDTSASIASTAGQLDQLAARSGELAGRNRDLQKSVDQAATTVSRIIADLDEAENQNPMGSSANTTVGHVASHAATQTRRALIRAQETLLRLSDHLGRTATIFTSTQSTLTKAAQSLRSHTSSVSTVKAQVEKDLSSSVTQLHGFATDTSHTVSASLTRLSSQLTPLMDDAVSVANDADAMLSDLSTSTTRAASTLTKAGHALQTTKKRLLTASDHLTRFASKMHQALTSGSAEQLSAITRSSADKLTDLIAAPISVKRHAVYPVATFGMQMTPFYSILATWVGSTLLAASVTPEVSERRRRGLRHLKQHQLYFGRQLSVTLIALLQVTLLGMGLLFFLRVQAVHPFLFMVTLWTTALVFSIIMFTLAYTLGSIGKAICVILLVVQISGSNGMYPVVLMPRFFSAIMPFLPATHAMNALRECIGGFYGTLWYEDMGKLLVFAVPMLIMSLALKKPLSLLSEAFGRATKASNLLP